MQADHKDAQCTGKHRFPNKHMAAQVARKTSQRHGQALGAYECPHCGGWHVGHPSGKRSR